MVEYPLRRSLVQIRRIILKTLEMVLTAPHIKNLSEGNNSSARFLVASDYAADSSVPKLDCGRNAIC